MKQTRQVVTARMAISFMLAVSSATAEVSEGPSVMRLRNRMPPPAWALQQRLLIDTINTAAQEFYDHYFDERGWYKGRLTWGIGIGCDDILQGLANWPLFYAMGGADHVLENYRRAFYGNIEQLTVEAVDHAPEWGVIDNDFVAASDMFHIDEWYQAFNQLPVADPYNDRYRDLALRFAGFFLNEGLPPAAEPIYCAQHNLIRSAVIGSRGATLEIDGSFWGLGWEELAERPAFSAWTHIRGDTIDNLGATLFVANAYLLTGDDKYRQWIEQYVGAWCQRAIENGGVFPSNVGLSGIVGEYWNGAADRHPFGSGSRNRPVTTALEIALLVSGNDKRFKDAIRLSGQGCNTRLYLTDFSENSRRRVAAGFSARKIIRDPYHLPWNHSIHDGYSCPFYFAPDAAWLKYVLGVYPDFPAHMLDFDLGRVRFHLNRMGMPRQIAPTTSGVTAGRIFRDIDWERNTEAHHYFMPAATHSLIYLAYGGTGHDNAKNPRVVLSELWYFDPENRRPGLPPDVAALIDTITRDRIGLHLINVNHARSRTVIVQTGSYAQHHCRKVICEARAIDVEGPFFTVELAPGSGGYIEMEIDRNINPPRAGFPWKRSAGQAVASDAQRR